MVSITREELRYNFLKTIIIRFDFQGVFEPEIENILPQIKKYLKLKGFKRYEKNKNNHIEINVSDDNSSYPEVNKVQSREVHSFTNEDRGYVLDISSSFICLNVSTTKYLPFEEYSAIISDIVDTCKKNIDFFTITRIGIRKINICMLADKERIKDFFSSKYFGYFEEVEDINTLMSARKDVFFVNDYKVNLQCNIEQGNANSERLFRVSLDMDIYIDNQSIIETAYNSDGLQKMNEILFDIYISTLTNDFLKALSGKNEKLFNGLIGVEQNE